MLLKLIKEHGVFVAILLVSALLRLVPLFEYQFTLDELSGLSRTRFDSFAALIDKGVKIDAHPAFVQVLIYYSSRLFGYVNWIIKLPFLLMSLGSICYGYAFGYRNFSKQSGNIAALILAFSLMFVFYSPIARMYASGVFFSMGLLYYFFEIFFRKQTWSGNYVLLGLFAVLCAYNHHMSALFALSVCASGLLFLNKDNAKLYIWACVGALVCYLPTLPVTFYQLGVGGIGFEQDGWLPVPELWTVFRFLRILLGTGKIWLLFFAATLLAVVLRGKISFTKQQVFLLVIFLLNYLIIYFYSVYRAPVYQHSVMMFSAVAFVMLVSSFIYFDRPAVYYLVMGVLTMTLLYRTYLHKDFLRQSVKTVFEYQFERTAHYKQLYGDKQVYPVFCDADEFMEQIYFKKYGEPFEVKISSDPETHSLAALSALLKNCRADYLVLSSSLPQQQALVREFYPYLVENTQTQAINYKVYSRVETDRLKSVEDDRVLMSSSVYKPGKFIYNKFDKVKRQQGEFVIAVDSLDEFPFEARAKYGDVVRAEGQVLLAESKIKLKRSPTAIETCISVNEEQNKECVFYNAKRAADFIIQPDSTVRSYVSVFLGTNHGKTSRRSPLVAYMWNRGRENFELRDFRIKLIDYCPRKWQLWD